MVCFKKRDVFLLATLMLLTDLRIISGRIKDKINKRKRRFPKPTLTEVSLVFGMTSIFFISTWWDAGVEKYEEWKEEGGSEVYEFLFTGFFRLMLMVLLVVLPVYHWVSKVLKLRAG